MSRPVNVTGCESDEISQKMCLGDAVLNKQDCLTRYCGAVLFTNYYMGRITSKEDENHPAQAAASLQNNH